MISTFPFITGSRAARRLWQSLTVSLLLIAGCSAPHHSVHLRDTDEYRVSDLLQIHPYAYLKNDINWFMDTYRNSGKTTHIENGRTIQGWKNIREFFENNLMQPPGEYDRHNHRQMDQGNLDVTLGLGNSSTATARVERALIDTDGAQLASGIFTAQLKKTAAGWKITESRFDPSPIQVSPSN